MDEKINDLIQREGFSLASNTRRILAYVIDNLLIKNVIFVLLHIDELVFAPDMNYADTYALTSSLLVAYFWQYCFISIIYESIFVWKYGASPGKLLLKLRIIKITLPDNPNLLDSIIRASLKLCGEFIFYISFLIAFADPFKRSAHDRVVKTIVVNDWQKK